MRVIRSLRPLNGLSNSREAIADRKDGFVRGGNSLVLLSLDPELIWHDNHEYNWRRYDEVRGA